MDIHSLMEKFAELEHAEVGRGPKHPTSPNPAPTEEIEAFLKQYPFLRRDQGYVDFLECYAGAWVMWPNSDLVIDLFGFTDVSRNIAEIDDAPILDENGFLTFCDGMIRIHEGVGLDGVIGQSFAFDTTGTRKWGVYRSTNDDRGISDMYWYCETFLEWLAAIIETKGKLPRSLTQP